MTTIGEPRVEQRDEQPYVGWRTRTPMRGMFAEVARLRKQVEAGMKALGVMAAGPPFLRYHVIDMAGEMDIEYGVPVAEVPVNGWQGSSGALPAGWYACLIYVGSGLQGNKALIEWARERGLAFDRWDDARGDAFASRYESFLTDPKVEPRKTKWEIEVAIKLAEADSLSAR